MPSFSGLVDRARSPLTLAEDVTAFLRLRFWARTHRAEHIFSERLEYFRHLQTNIIGHAEPIVYLEFGVKRGASLKQWLALNTHPDSRFVGFDTFTGIPEPWEGRAVGAMDCGGKPPAIADSRASFVKGLFQDTLVPFLRDFSPDHRLVVHNDCDLGSATLFVLTQMDPWMVPGSLLLFDEFYSASHEFQAFTRYTEAYYRRFRLLAAVRGKSIASRPYKRAAFERLP